MHSRWFALCLIGASALAGTAAPARAAGEPFTWLGVTLGAPVASLRATKGDPMRVVRFPDDMIAAGLLRPGDSRTPERKANYWLGDTIFLIVSERHGYVVGIEAYADTPPPAPLDRLPADPHGALLGQTVATVAAFLPEKPASLAGLSTIHSVDKSSGLDVVYEFKGGLLDSIQWSRAPAQDPAQAELPEISDPAGDAFATAILDAQSNESTGVRWEYLYVSAHPCDGRTRWQTRGQALGSNGGRSYDILHVACPTTKAERDFFFDITPYFGKM